MGKGFISVEVKWMDSKKYQFRIKQNEPLQSLVNMIIEKEGNLNNFRLAYQGKNLTQMQATLESLNITHGSTINVINRLNGGGIFF